MEKKVIVCGIVPIYTLPEDVFLVVWDSAEALKPVQQSFSMESLIQYTTVEMEEIKEQAEKRAKDQFKKMLSKPKRKGRC